LADRDRVAEAIRAIADVIDQVHAAQTSIENCVAEQAAAIVEIARSAAVAAKDGAGIGSEILRVASSAAETAGAASQNRDLAGQLAAANDLRARLERFQLA
jgi:methyl-accepting chemotaxis protein